MNLILLFEQDFISPFKVILKDRRFDHLKMVMGVTLNQRLSVGKINGRLGLGLVVSVNVTEIELEVQWNALPPKSLPVTLIIAMIRPPMFKRLIFHATTLGIKKIIVLNFHRVEKSLWTSSSLHSDQIQQQLILGLEQCKDTILPQVVLQPHFKSFMKDQLPALIEGTLPLIAQPGSNQACPKSINGPATLVIGPEGGILDYELDQFCKIGFQAMDLGDRIMRVETVLPFLMGRLYD